MHAECGVCGELDCQRQHDCSSCCGDAVKQCDREHLTCDDCSWTTGDGPDVVEWCAACEWEDEP
jgi:hypothetical protein